MSKKYKNPIAVGILLSIMLVATILAVLTSLNVNSYQIMTIVGFIGIILFLYSLKNLTKQEIEIESLKEMKSTILITLGGNFGYLLIASLAIILFGQEAIANNYYMGTGMSLCFVAIVLLGIRLTKTKNEIAKEAIKGI
ncbi:hypothetical protein KAS31_02245 [Candidatus Parcubacteria bacterium]|nr:hypothetical protein [Candidatus Parcubacteria bacterium]